MTGSAKRGLIADPNSTYLETRNLTCEFGKTLILGSNAFIWCNMKVIRSSKIWEDMIHQS